MRELVYSKIRIAESCFIFLYFLLLLVTMNIMTEIKERVNAQKFRKEPVSRDVLENILEAGRLAPSAKNRQPWRFVVLQEDIFKKSIMACAYGDERIGQASAVVAVCTTNIGYRMPNGELSYPMDLSFAVSQMTIQAVHEGLGTALITTFDQDAMKKLLSIPYSMKVMILLLVGKEEDRKEKTGRLPFERVVSFNHW